jgi:hypothetical protein
LVERVLKMTFFTLVALKIIKLEAMYHSKNVTLAVHFTSREITWFSTGWRR